MMYGIDWHQYYQTPLKPTTTVAAAQPPLLKKKKKKKICSGFLGAQQLASLSLTRSLTLYSRLGYVWFTVPSEALWWFLFIL